MNKRRPLVEGLANEEEILSEAEKDFVFGPDAETPAEVSPQKDQEILPKMTGRVPITIRARPGIGSALKRASLQRQLDGVEPCTMQDIVDEALENWLSTKGYLD